MSVRPDGTIDTSDYISDQTRDAFRAGYVSAMLWANAVDPATGEPTEDVTYAYIGPGRWWEDTPVELADAESFLMAHHDLMLSASDDFSQHGHDFALTRNHHGAGFWDRGYPEHIGSELTAAAHAYGEEWVDIADADAEDACPACGEYPDYCQGHGAIGDPVGYAILHADDDTDD
jgi:hypothetical protein